MPTIKVGTDGEDPTIRRVEVDGEIDLVVFDELQERLSEASEGPGAVVIVDLDRCLFIDSRGLSALLNAARRLTRSGGALAVVCPNPTPYRVFEITNTRDTLNVAPTESEARALALSWRERLRAGQDTTSSRAESA
ncbi:MAG TPA: STAS domain-containing protein [Thermoleophilaceae bacterium]|jgi:anti-anti-sigma factor